MPQSLTKLENLNTFHFQDTGLCAPYHYDFLQWLEGIESYQGEVCAPSSDQDVLTMLYHSTNGDAWTNKTNWVSDKPLYEWNGIDTNADGRVTGINLQGNNLTGKIPTGLGTLSKLDAGLNLQTNNLAGAVPADVGNLSVLRELRLFGNSGLSGSLPQSFTQLNNLWRLRYINTGLCAPSNDEFQTWLEGKWPEASYPGNNIAESATFNGDRNCAE